MLCFLTVPCPPPHRQPSFRFPGTSLVQCNPAFSRHYTCLAPGLRTFLASPLSEASWCSCFFLNPPVLLFQCRTHLRGPLSSPCSCSTCKPFFHPVWQDRGFRDWRLFNSSYFIAATLLPNCSPHALAPSSSRVIGLIACTPGAGRLPLYLCALTSTPPPPPLPPLFRARSSAGFSALPPHTAVAPRRPPCGRHSVSRHFDFSSFLGLLPCLSVTSAMFFFQVPTVRVCFLFLHLSAFLG